MELITRVALVELLCGRWTYTAVMVPDLNVAAVCGGPMCDGYVVTRNRNSVPTAMARSQTLRLDAAVRAGPWSGKQEKEAKVLTRRELLERGAAGGTALMLAARIPLAASPAAAASPALTKFTESLPIPAAIDLTGGGSASLAMASASSYKFHSQLGAASTFGYGGAPYLGPTLLVKQTVPVSITFMNNLGAHPLAASIDTTLGGALADDKTTPRASVHVHGGLTPPRFDGHPEDTYLPGSSKDYNYPAPHPVHRTLGW